MAYLQELIRTQNQYIAQQQIYSTVDMGLRSGEAYSSYFPTWEVTAPQYPVPTPYTLAQLGFCTNEVAYACIDLWMNTISEPKIKVYDKKAEEFIDDHPLYEFMEEPCPGLTETDFWDASVMYLKIAGFMGWEKDRSNDNSLIALWPMLPQYCSFMRGERQLLRATRYQPYTGLPALEIPRERSVFFSYINPLYFGVKFLSPTAVLKDIIGVDNNMTTMIDQFLKNGFFSDGLLKTEQVINEADARFAKERWQETHGGFTKAGEVAVLGKGLSFERSGHTNREFMFPEVDARNEVRICMGYAVKPILISAKVGMDRSTMNNYKEGKSSWYEESATSEWQFLEERCTKDLLREFDQDINHVCKFDLSHIKALQEDRNEQWKRADDAYKARIITRNQALIEKGLDPLDDEVLGSEYYQTAMTQTSMSTQDDLDEPNVKEIPKTDVDVSGNQIAEVKEEDEQEEEKHFRAFAKRRIKENKQKDIPEFEFKYLSEKKQRKLLSEYGVADPDAELVLQALLEVVKNINRPQDISIKAMLPELPAPIVNIENNMPEMKQTPPAQVTVEVLPTPIQNNVEVNPTPIENKIEVNTPKLKKSFDKVMRDTAYNIKGKMTEYEYEGDS